MVHITVTQTGDYIQAIDVEDTTSRPSGGFTKGTKVTHHTVRVHRVGDDVGRLCVYTDDDRIDEPDGVISATLVADSGYTIGARSTVSFGVRDNDPPARPRVTVVAGGDVTEGGTASFTVTPHRRRRGARGRWRWR
ncbi:MAG: hypothetical protein F4118_08600 [Acidimicrobiaceae bacterium]|nr:hypothetical protein [Acidimicrobiaceae bacterium]MYI36205.1 hypothetical protein [Acidimicrobiaceae bacterium]MYI36478.1 hypothetical protein [Acidimicrobiaceae bacterium]